MPKAYSQKSLLDAVSAVRHGMSYRRAAKQFGVPVMTIQNRVCGKIDDLAQAGRPTVIPPEVEEKLVDQIKKAGNMVCAEVFH
jgi:transposase